MRLDRSLTLALSRPWRRLAGRPPGPGIPVLMYHSIGAEISPGRHAYFRTATTPGTFLRHMKTLRRRGVRTLTLSQAAFELANPSLAPAGPAVALTFDDAYLDFRTAAWPVLESLGMSATVFVSTAYMGRDFPAGPRCMATADVLALARAGVEIGSHTVTHPQLVDVPRLRLWAELGQSHATLSGIVGHPVTSFSYPYRFPSERASFRRQLEAALVECGYRQGVTTTIGIADTACDSLFMRRLPINDDDDDALFAAKLDGDYDWMRRVQSMRKALRRLVPARTPPTPAAQAESP